MPKLLSGYVAAQVNKYLGPQLLPATLIKMTQGARTPGNLSGGMNQTFANYAARGFVEGYAAHLIDGSVIQINDRKISLLGKSIAGGQIPATGDRIVIEGATYDVIGVPERDPDGAMYICQCRQ